MITRAVAQGSRLGVIATAETTLEATRLLLEAEAQRCGKPIHVELVFVSNALLLLLAGDKTTHDRLVRAAALDLMPRTDLVVLAQATMARVLDVIPEAERQVPVLASPPLALALVARILETGT